MIALKMEMRRYIAESRQVESQLLANRRVIGMLLNRLQQSFGCNQVKFYLSENTSNRFLCRTLGVRFVFKVGPLGQTVIANVMFLQT